MTIRDSVSKHINDYETMSGGEKYEAVVDLNFN